MDIVINNTVKMEWDKKGFLTTKRGVFAVATKVYPTEKGEIAVFFVPGTAFIWASDYGTENEDLWSQKELRDWLKENFGSDFPRNFDEYQPIIAEGKSECSERMLEKYGLGEFKSDIEARLQDIAPYGVEFESANDIL